MTGRDLIRRGIDRLWRPPWARNSYLEVTRLPNGSIGPWATVVSPPITEQVLIFQAGLDEDGWEAAP